MHNLRKKIRKILSEYHGVQDDLKKLSIELTKGVVEKLNSEYDKISDGQAWDMLYQVRLNEKIGFIGMITIKISYQEADKKPNGFFEVNKTVLLDNDTYSIEINLRLHKVDDKEINYIISHELNHAFVNIKELYGKRKNATYNRANKIMKNELRDYMEQYPEIKRFLNMTYLSNPQEVQARVQEVVHLIEYSNEKNAEDTFDYLLKFQPLSDAKKMIAYSTDEILKYDKEILGKILYFFNDGVKNQNHKPRTFSDTDSFFKYWKRVINKSGEELARKIYKLVSDKFLINEVDLYEYSFEWVFGKSFDEWFDSID
jgi:hypothetical protein